MTTNNTTQKTAYFEDYRLEYRITHAEEGIYGITCAAYDADGQMIAQYDNPALTTNTHAAEHLLGVLADNAVFPMHIDDLLADARGTLLAADLLTV